MSSTRWLFENYDPDTANIPVNIADLVKNLTLDNPGVLGAGAIGQDRPSDEAGLLAREAVQNALTIPASPSQQTHTVTSLHLSSETPQIRSPTLWTII